MAAIALMAFFPAVGRAAIRYVDFGSSLIDTSNGQEDVSNFLGTGGDLTIRWVQAGSTARQGQIVFDPLFLTGENVNISLLTTDNSSSPVVTLEEDEAISGDSVWRTQTQTSLIYSYTIGTGTFNPNFLTPSKLGVIGVRFNYSENYYYGWIEVTDIAFDGSSFTISKFAYNDTPNEPILALQTEDPPPPPPSTIPEPASLGMILLGAAGIYALRRRDD